VVLCNAPPDHAETIARALLEQRLAACVNIVPGVTSLYWWKGAITRDGESMLLIKTRPDLVAKLTDAIRAVHPYEVPEVLELSPTGQGNPAYHAWVMAETEALEP
jgi:periplasmic divalent cation tolerance protein